ncbi:hypothetical protein [Sphingobacterium sp. HMA12]|uniref:hypothetical protein n=1 Tax=Sphingobacterium sp. HMA12 TaxID=2050894 RepID=UPI0013153A77|nr:hypothetical protein [Sphingobacterium sp. HMA12]
MIKILIKNRLFLRRLLRMLLIVCGPYAVCWANTDPGKISPLIKAIEVDRIGGQLPELSYEKIGRQVVKVKVSLNLPQDMNCADWQIRILPAFQPNFHWAPHLTPSDDHIIAQHVFRAPMMMLADQRKQLVIIPDVDLLNRTLARDWYMDMDAERNQLTLGRSLAQVAEHVLFKRKSGNTYASGKFEFAFYVLSFDDREVADNPFRRPLAFYWKKWGEGLFDQGEPISGDLETYVRHSYHWAFQSWVKQVWQSFEINGKKVGAPTFIVNTTQSPNYPGKTTEREFRSIWNQAWFSSLRSASGLYRFAKRTGNQDLLDKANLTKELTLSYPKKKGFFYGLIGTEMEDTTDGDGTKKSLRSKGWAHYYWGNSNRNPYTWDARKSPFHILDMSWTALLMLRWYDELEKDPRLLAYAEDYGKSLLEVQSANGFFPGWLDVETLKPLAHLNESPESALSVTFLLMLYRITQKEEYKLAALKAMQAIMREIIPDGRWEDFETYWSCSRIGSEDWVGKKVSRNDMYKQNNFSMFWTAEALLECYQVTKSKEYLKTGQRTLDELLMTQAAWQPHFIPIKALGGFGVMNADGEWNDARQSLFAELIIRYGKELKQKEYLQRGLAALRASFVMMYCPENPDTKAQWEEAWPFFGKEDYGFMMENYGHGGETNAKGLGIGEFTIYDWGNGAAAEAYNRILDHYGTDFIAGKKL